MAQELSKTYSPQEIEEKIYKKWLDGGYFHTEPDPDKEPFTIVIPPPNVTGQLHLGHALDETIQDILIRRKRMQGYAALWVPGTDHAGIATQIKVEENLRKEKGLTRYDLGREEFLKTVWDWKEQYGSRIINQLKKLGCSCDWDRERFTMDKGCSKAVREVFVNLYNKGLIYKGNRIINWCPHCTTALSDAEVDYEEQKGNFWHIKYPIKDSDDFIVIATTRPETMLGDSAIAVHPDDERYKDIVGKMVLLPLTDREIPIIADEYVDPEFGTGCVKITPCHDPNDFEVGQRHNLEKILIMDENAKINKNGGKFCGMDRYEARKAIVEELSQLGLLVKTEEHVHNVGTCYRCGNTVEPMTSSQWFVKMEPLAKPAVAAVKNGDVKFVPDRFSKTYLNWMENVHDWCISRQLWWGHRIPAFYCQDCGEMTVSKEDITVCPKCKSTNIKQEEDVLDTWFSSALWPFSTLGWPENTKELSYFFPTSVLVTGYDIIFFWVARMIFSSLEHVGKVPFDTVFIHGIVRDDKGRKMSKSLGNGIDPIEVINTYGADALRFTLATGNSPGNDMRFYKERVEASRNFANKLWNAARFALMNINNEEIVLPSYDTLESEDKWIISKFNTLCKEVNYNLDNYEIGIAVAKMYDFAWDYLCDWYIELIKPRLFAEDKKSGSFDAAQNTLCFVLTGILKLLHPIIPFITEEIYMALPTKDETIMIAKYPEYSPDLSFEKDEADTEKIISAIKAIRNTRTEMNVPPSKKADIYIETEFENSFRKASPFFERLAGAQSVSVAKKHEIEKAVTVVSEGAVIYIPKNQLTDSQKETERLTKERERLLSEIARIDKMLSNKGFVDKAPEKIVASEREKKKTYENMLAEVIKSLSAQEDN